MWKTDIKIWVEILLISLIDLLKYQCPVLHEPEEPELVDTNDLFFCSWKLNLSKMKA